MSLIKNMGYSIADKFRPVLSDRSIMEYNKKKLLVEQPLKKEQVQPNSIDLTLGDTWKVLRPNATLFYKDMIDPREPIKYETGTFYDTPLDGKELPEGLKWFKLDPHQFCLMASNEILNIPNGILSFVQGRSSIARLAIQTEQAGLIDAGFRGTITFEVFNQSNYPIILYTGMRIAQVYFFKAQRADKIYGAMSKGSKYYSQIEATGSRINEDPELH